MAKHIQTIRRQIAALLILRLKGSASKAWLSISKLRRGVLDQSFNQRACLEFLKDWSVEVTSRSNKIFKLSKEYHMCYIYIYMYIYIYI